MTIYLSLRHSGTTRVNKDDIVLPAMVPPVRGKSHAYSSLSTVNTVTRTYVSGTDIKSTHAEYRPITSTRSAIFHERRFSIDRTG